ncbi:MAG: alpha-amylase family glycosyl hydrolase [Chloroflexota bacterium]|jgi:sucrose phosphorylase
MANRIPYQRDPDFGRPLLEIDPAVHEHMLERLAFLYGRETAERWMPELERILKVHHAHKPPELIEFEAALDPDERFTERDLILITYADAVRSREATGIEALHRFVETYYDSVNTIHMLPFFPYSSDRGFAVVDFKSVDPKVGNWDQVRELAFDYDLMFDAVFNHASSRSEMFRGYLRGDPQYRDFFIAYDSPDDLTVEQRSKIFRPRTSDILTRYETIDGPKYIWTTFSPDQIDFNFRNPAVLLAVLEALLFYVRRGADIIRLDAVTYLWSEPGTESIHLPQTHEIIKLLRDVLDTVAPSVALVTETNVPHQQNISYFGNGHDEAHMVYNFALPPLVLHTFYSEDTTAISEWAAGLELPSGRTHLLNMLDTHDGIGLQGVKGILTREQVAALIEHAREHGAYISYKATAQGEEPYEINSTWWSAINVDGSTEPIALQVKRYVASRSVALVLKGVPGIYTHGAIALPNDHALVERTGVRRDVNRGVIDTEIFREHLHQPGSKRSLLRLEQREISKMRTRLRAFHPRGEMRVLRPSPSVFAVLRVSPEGDRRVLTLTNITGEVVTVECDIDELGVSDANWYDLVAGEHWNATGGTLRVELGPYDVMWLVPTRERLEDRRAGR